MTSQSGPAVLFGAAMDTGNLGVAALGTSVLEGFHRHAHNRGVLIFDNGTGRRQATAAAGSETIPYELAGAWISRRYYRPESLRTMFAMAPLRGLLNPSVRAIAEAPAVLDVSGGDSFTDMYGERRFRLIELPKLLAMRMKRPLVLLPQTYGPFRTAETQKRAAVVLRGASTAWARDAESYERLQDILGADFDADRHRLGVDMAFGLSPTEPTAVAHDSARAWLEANDRPVAGINVSGLLWGKSRPGAQRDDLSVNYHRVITDLANRLIESGARVMLVAHVIGTRPGSESDELAIIEALPGIEATDDAVLVMPTSGLTAGEAKWWISHCDWFTGARMHSTIAALSTGVPTAAIAYSLKTQPVFATVGLADRVIDGRTAATDETIDFLWSQWLDRDAIRQTLAANLGAVKEAADDQMLQITSDCETFAPTP